MTGYDYEGRLVAGADQQAPVLYCRPGGPVPLPSRIPEVAWRPGLDLNPLDAADGDDAAWLSCLLWPGERGGAERLAGALATVRRSPPALHRGDLLDDLPGLAAQAPPCATLVVYHSAVLLPLGHDPGRQVHLPIASFTRAGRGWRY